MTRFENCKALSFSISESVMVLNIQIHPQNLDEVRAGVNPLWRHPDHSQGDSPSGHPNLFLINIDDCSKIILIGYLDLHNFYFYIPAIRRRGLYKFDDFENKISWP